MATVRAQPLYAHHALPRQEEVHPPSPTLTNPDLILPHETRYSMISPTLSAEIRSDSSHPGSPTNVKSTHRRSDSDGSGAELGIATAVMVPVRLSAGPPSAIPKPTQLTIYQGYEHGAPLSDIGEEGETEIEDNSESTSATREKGRSPSPQEVDEIEAEVDLLASPPLRHRKGLSNISVESAESDKTEWTKFDTSNLVSDRVVADIARARSAADTEATPSRRNSKEADEELSALNDRADQILESARKRLSHMEDNLSKARHSILLSGSRSIPNMHEFGLGQQPGGGLYRSISQSAANRRSRAFPIKPNTVLSHGRAGSDNIGAGNPNRLSRTPEVRSVSALEFGRPWLGASTPEKLHNEHSPSSSRSFNSPLRRLAEEAESPSTMETSPSPNDTPTLLRQKGLGINTTRQGQEELGRYDQSSPSPALERSNSQASMRSTKELKDQMIEMRSRIAELKSKAQADTLRRRSIQSLRASSPFNSSSPESGASTQRRSSPPGADVRATSSLEHAAEPVRERQSAPRRAGHQRKDSALDDDIAAQGPMLQTPVTDRTQHISALAGVSSARTDRNTPNLVSRVRRVEEESVDFESQIIPSSTYAHEEQNIGDEDDEDDVFANEEEQIYLNEVLEESLHEPEVPTIPLDFLDQSGGGEERHEDRLDAFDYENMFLHSAMGTYTGTSESDDDDDNSESASVHTSRRNVASPDRVRHSDDSDSELDEMQVTEKDQDRSTDANEEVRSNTSSPLPSFSQPASAPRLPTLDQATLKPQSNPWIKSSRSNSMSSTSSAASFETATEGHRTDVEQDDSDDDTPDEILNWGSSPGDRLAIPRSEQTLASSPLGAAVHSTPHGRHDSGSGIVSNREVADINGTVHSHPRSNMDAMRNVTSPTNSSGRQSILTVRQYGRESSGSHHRHSRSISTDLDELDDDLTPQVSTFQHDRIKFPASHSKRSSVLSTHTRSGSTSTTITVGQDPRATSAASISKRPLSRQSHRQSGSVTQLRSDAYIRPSSATKTSPAHPSPPSAHQGHPANTEILMESLIKLADPAFSLRSDTRFAEVDKELVLKLLRALGGVCNGVLHADRRGDARVVHHLRGRLRDGEEVLLHGLSDDGFEDDREDDREDDQNRMDQQDRIDEHQRHSSQQHHRGSDSVALDDDSHRYQRQYHDASHFERDARDEYDEISHVHNGNSGKQTVKGLGITSPSASNGHQSRMGLALL